MTSSVHAVALFFDDIRYEMFNKFSLMGQYVGELTILDPATAPVDRLAVLVHARWPIDMKPKILRLRIEIPRQDAIEVDLSQQEFPDRPQPPSPFTERLFQAGVNLRFPPLQAGDLIDVWMTVDDEVLPAGRLRISTPTNPPQPVAGDPKA